MTIVGFSFPTAIRFGAGARKEVARHLLAQGLKRPLVVTDKALAALPVLAEFRTHLAGLDGAKRTEAMLDITRRQSFRFYQDAIALRHSSPAFRADAEVNRVYTHNEDSVMAFTRKAGGEEYLVVGSLNRENLEGYTMPLPPGNWKEVLNSDAAVYGGDNFGNYGAKLSGGNTKVNIPAAGYVVFKKE